jgi:3-carboxy-cis,cis-muconate cycloisomerase
MPHKRNPVSSSIMLAAAVRVPALVATMLSSMVQEHERGLGGWQVEWETLPEIFRLTSGSLRSACEAISGLTVDVDSMRQHLHSNGGIALSESIVFTLAPKIGKSQAHHLLEQVTRTTFEQHLSFREALLQSADICAHLSIAEIDQALDPVHYLGSARNFIDNVLAREEKN